MTEIERRKVVVSMPVKGFAFSMEKVNDAVFAQEMIGPGFAAMPSEGVLYAPVDGKIGMLANTLHSIVVTTPEGAEILIHVGIDTVKLCGKHFKAHAEPGNNVERGDKLLEFDYDALVKDGYDITIPVVLINKDEFEICENRYGEKKVGDYVLVIQRKGA